MWSVNVSFLSLSFSSFHSFPLLLWVGEALPCFLIIFFLFQTFWSLFGNCLQSRMHIRLSVLMLLIPDKQQVSGKVYKGKIHVF